MQRTVSLAREGLSKGIGASLKEFGDQVPEFEDLEDRLMSWDRRAHAFIKERPIACLAGALALGIVVGRLVRDRG